MIYFDNAATSFPKPNSVTKELLFCLEKYSGNPGRSGHKLAAAAAEKIFQTRERIAEHFGSSTPENVVFTLNATYAINIAIRTKIKSGSHIITSDIEHNAVMRPLALLKKERNIDYSVFSTNGDIRKNIIEKLQKNTTAIISTMASNITGRPVSIKILSDIAKELDLMLIVDASQSAGHEKIDLGNTPCDCLCAPGHKGLFGIQGAGFIIFSSSDNIKPFLAGGNGTNSISLFMPAFLPEALEAGTLPTPAIASISAGIDFIESVGIDAIKEKECMLAQRLKNGLSLIKNVKLYESHSSIVLFNITGVSESKICSELDSYGVCVRGGLHCAPYAHRINGTEDIGAVRASLSYFNTQDEVDKFLKILSKIRAEL